ATPQAADTTAPVGTVAINGGGAYTASTAATLALAATDGIGVTGYFLSASSTTPTAGAAGWTAVTAAPSYNGSAPYTLAAGDGNKTVYTWYKDAAGNVSTAASASILLDTTAPTNGTVTPTVASGQISLNWTGFTDTGS